MKDNRGIAHIIIIIIGILVILVLFGFFSVKHGSGSNTSGIKSNTPDLQTEQQ